jgi:hypothetical protein
MGYRGHLLRSQIEIFATSRSQHDLWASHLAFTDLDRAHARSGVDAHDLDSVAKVIA